MEEEGRQDVVRDVNMLENDSNSSKSDSYDDGVEILDEQMEEESEVVVKGVISLEMAKGGCEEGKKDNVEVEVNGKDKQVDDNVEEERNESYPRVGMEFKSQEEAYEFYCWYAMKTGFKVRKNSTCRSRRSNQVIGRNYVCSRQGVKDHSRESTSKGKVDYRTDCKAYISLRRRSGNKWVLSKLHDEHNHEMESSNKRQKLQSLKKMSQVKEKLLENMCLAGFRLSPMMNCVAPKAEGNRSVGSSERKSWNALSTKRQRELKREDVEALLNYFEKQQIENPSFFYSIQVDSEGHMTNFFWADARSRMDYHHFSDLVCFDPTYKTNRSGLPFIPILGINHHYQTVLFGSALLYDESEESFQWLLKTWMRAVNGKEPKVLVTDPDSAIAEVVERVLPGCHHRFCLWKIVLNAKENMTDVINAHEGFIKDFTECMNGNETIERFESNWGRMLESYSLGENKWLMKLFGKREKWASVYARDIFYPSIFTNQRTEETSPYFMDCYKGDMPLSEFVTLFEKSVIFERGKEYNADSESNNGSPSLRFAIDIEKEAAKIYTKEIFQKFQDQLSEGICYRHKKVEESGQMLTYTVWKTGQEEIVGSVKLDYPSMSAKCTCRLFELAGYLCRHILKVFLVENVENFPPQYILKRWTKDAKSGSVVSDEGENMHPSFCENVTDRYYNLCQEAINIAAKGSASTEAFKIAILCLHNAMEEVEAALKKDSTERTACNINVVSGNKDNTTVGRVEKSLENQSTPFVLPTVKHKGRPKGLKPRVDKLPVKKMSVTKKTPSKPHTLVSSQISFAAPNKNAYEPQQNRGKFGQNLQLKIAVENDQFQRSKRPAVPNPISDHQSENMASHSYYQPSARELEFHTLSHASPATEDLSNFTQSYYMNDTHPFSLVSPTQHFHCLNQDSSVVGQSLGISQHDGLVANSSYLRRYQLGQGNPPAFVISPHQSQGNTSIDLNGPNRDL